MTFDRSRIGLPDSSLRQRQRYSEDGNLSDDIGDSLDNKRGQKPTDLSEILKRSRSKSSNGSLRGSDLRTKTSLDKPDGIKSRLGDLGGSRKRRLDTGVAGITTASLAKRALSGPSLGIAGSLKKNIIQTVRENEKRLIKPETFIEKKTKTGEAIDWDSKLSRPRFGMVADMSEKRVSAKSRIKNGASGGDEDNVIKRTVPNVKSDRDLGVKEQRLQRNIVMTEVVEEEFEDFNIVKTVENDYEMEAEDEEGFLEGRVIQTRDKFTELQIRKQKQRSEQQQQRGYVDLENDDGRDLPEWSDQMVIEVANEREATPPPILVSSSVIAARPKIEPKRKLDKFETKKTKQLREAENELRLVQEREKKLEARKRLKEEEEALKKEREDIERRKRIEEEKKKTEDEKKRKDLERKKQEEAKLEAVRIKNERLKLEQELKKREDTLKIEEEEKKIKELQRQEEALQTKIQEKQKEVEKEKQELEKVKQAKHKEQEDEIMAAQRKKIENDGRIKKEIKAIEEQEKQIRDRQKQLQKKKQEKKREMRRRSKKKKSRKYSSDESSSSDSEMSDSESESSSSESESETSLSESEDSEYERKQRKKGSSKHSKSKHKSSKKPPVKKSQKEESVPSREVNRPRETREIRDTKRPEPSKSDARDRRRPAAAGGGGGGSSRDGTELRDKLKNYLSRAKSVGPK